MSLKSLSTKDPSETCSNKSETESEVDSEDENNFVLREVPVTETQTVCKLCFRPAQSSDSSLKLGPLYEFGYCVAHLYCLMFSAGLDQNGSDDEGINGFLAKDIVKEWRRGSRLLCIYCKGKYATIGCVGNKCKKSYHLPCGLENGSQQQFFGNFVSYCRDHKPVQAPLLETNRRREEMWQKRDECGCCTMELEEEGGTTDFLWTPCCNGWFHRQCIEKTAENAGTHFFKCPLCNNKDEFTAEMLAHGVYVPDRDADWETSNMFADQLQRHDSCDADSCSCPQGRKFDEEDTPWEIMLCVCCGAQGIHVECGQLDVARPRWKCPLCRPVVARLPNKPISVFTRVKRSQEPPNKEFKRNVLENLTFRVSQNYQIDVDMHKNRRNPKDPVVVSFKVNGVPAFDIPNPVKVKKNELDNASDKIQNIPCPFDGCEELVSRLQFKDHCKEHRADGDDNSSYENTGDDTVETAVEHSVTEDTDAKEDRHESQTSDIELPGESVEAANKSIEEVDEAKVKELLTNLEKPKTSEKQSTILSFFKRFDPKPKQMEPPTKKLKLDREIELLKTPPKATVISPPKDTVISSPLGYFKVG